jgi:hypothetical protein
MGTNGALQYGMELLGDHAMKTRWTLSLAAVALIVGAFPAFANQSPTAAEREKTGNKIDAAARTPYLTPHQGKTLKRAVDSGNERAFGGNYTDEQAAMSSGSTAPAPAATAPAPAPQTAPASASAPTPKPAVEAPQSEYRFMGTACGEGEDLALFDKGGKTPSVLRTGDTVVPGVSVVAIEDGCVTLEQTVPAAKKGESPRKNRYDLYNW